MPSLFASSELFDLIEKVEKGERLDRDAGLRMMKSQDILALGYMANIVRERKNGNQTYITVSELDHATMNIDKSLDEQVKNVSVCDATMLYGVLVSAEGRTDHLLELRALQDQTGEFQGFMPLSYDPNNSVSEGTMGGSSTTGIEDLKVLAISRILLDNFEHIKASWIMLGLKLTQVSLAFGVDELEGNLVEERISHAVDVETRPVMTKRAMIHMIQKAGRDAVERNGLGGSPCTRRP